MKTCDDVIEKILSGMENDPDVMAHIANCPECKELAADVKQIRLSPGAKTPSPALDAAIHNIAVMELEEKQARPRIFRRAVMHISAAAIVAICACVLGIYFAPEEHTAAKPALAKNTTGTANVDQLQLERLLYSADNEIELLSLSMEIQRADEIFASVNNSNSRFYNY